MKQLPVLILLLFACSLCAQNDAEPPLTPSVFSVWSQRMDLSAYIGKKYRLTVAIRALPGNQEAFAVAFIRNEVPEGGLRAWTFMDNMMDRPVRDSTWKTYTLEYSVDKDAPWIGFGVLAYSNGQFFYDDMHLSIEKEAGEWTELPVPNGNFENDEIDPWQQTAQGVPVRVLGAKAIADSRAPFEGKQCLMIENRFLKK